MKYGTIIILDFNMSASTHPNHVTESEYGVSLTLHSEGSIDTYPSNSPSSFTNVLKIPVRLGGYNDEYEVCLSNIHVPAYQHYLLKTSDGRENDIKFQIGMFGYDAEIGDWRLFENSKVDVFSYGLHKNISGLEHDDNDVSRDDFIKRLNRSFGIKEKKVEFRKNCLSFLNTYLRHKYEGEKEGHKPGFVADCNKCGSLIKENGHERPDFFENYDPNRKNHIWIKNLEDLDVAEKYYIFDNLFRILGIDKYKYLADIIHKGNGKNIKKRHARRLANSIKDKDSNEKYEHFQNIFAHEKYRELWGSSGLIPQLVLYASFGDKMCDYLSVDRGTSIGIVSCGNENLLSMHRDNRLLTPKFQRRKLNSLFIYSDLVKKSQRLGDHTTNLLGIVTINSDLYSKPNTVPIYRPISHNYIQSVSVRITDQDGLDPYFKQGSYAALEIVIRKRQPLQ